MEPHDPHPCSHGSVLMGPVLRVRLITAYFKSKGAAPAMSCQKARVFRLSLLLPPFWCSVCLRRIEVPSMAGHLGVISPQYFDWLWVSLVTSDPYRKMLCRPKLIATLIIVHKHSYLEGNLTGAACPSSKIKAIAFPTGHMPSQDVGICLGFPYQTWTLFCGPSIAQTFLIVVYDLVSPVSIMHPGGQWVTLQDLLYMRFAGAWAHSIVHPHPWSLLVSLHPKPGVFPPCCFLPPQRACL